MSWIIDFGLMIISTALLIFGADRFLDGVRDLSQLLKISPLVLGVILVGLEPEEMLTAAFASGRGASGIAVGNVIGTNVTIVTCALGLSSLLCPLVLERGIRRQALMATLVSLLPVIFLLSGIVTRLEGIFLLFLFIGYTILLLRTDRRALERVLSAEDDEPGQSSSSRWRVVAWTLGGLLVLAVGGYLLVEGAQRLASASGLGDGVIGATFVSLATGGEMIALGVTAARKGQTEVLVGGILGSFAYNLLVTLGVAAIVRPLPVDLHQFLPALIVMIVAHLILLLLIWHGAMGKLMGVLFVIIYIAYLALLILLR